MGQRWDLGQKPTASGLGANQTGLTEMRQAPKMQRREVHSHIIQREPRGEPGSSLPAQTHPPAGRAEPPAPYPLRSKQISMPSTQMAWTGLSRDRWTMLRKDIAQASELTTLRPALQPSLGTAAADEPEFSTAHPSYGLRVSPVHPLVREASAAAQLRLVFFMEA